MNAIVPCKQTHEGFCSLQCIKGSSIRNSGSRGRVSTRVPVNFCPVRVFLALKVGFADLSVDLKKEFECGKRRENWVCAISKNESLAIDGRASHHERSSSVDSPSLGSIHPSYDEFEGNNKLHRLVGKGKLHEGFKLLESVVCRGDIPHMIICTRLIRGFM